MTITYRKNTPSGDYQLIIISLIHQNKFMLDYMISNIERYLEGKYLFCVHYNGSEDVDENTLPSWVWLNRSPIHTQRFTRRLSDAIIDTMGWVLQYVNTINIMLISSGSVFFRRWQIPSYPQICIESHEKIFNPSKNLIHTSAIPIENKGRVVEYLRERGSGGWQYGFEGHGCDLDIHFHECLHKRGIQFFRGCQWSGQLWPQDVGKMIVEDLTLLKNKPMQNYACEEIYFSTYAYHHYLLSKIPIQFCEVITNWEFKYDIHDIQYIIDLHQKHPLIGHAICKLPDDVNHPVRKFIQHFYYSP